MARLTLFQYVVLKHSTSPQVDSEILIEPGTMLARSEKIVATKLARQIPEADIDDLENIEVLVRPF